MKFLKSGIATALVVASVSSQAAAVDVAAIVTEIGSQAAPVALVAGAVLLIHLAVKGFKWVRAAMA
jgi:hypothetical protein